jgi:3-hydroxybutyryl-CoA dehydratase
MLVKWLIVLHQNNIGMDIISFKESFENGKLSHIFRVTEDVYTSFQICSGDMNPLHTNEAFAQNKGFKERVMYGNILNAFVSFFVGECLPTNEVIIHSQDIAFKQPVYLKDELHFEAEIEGIYESVNTIEFKFKFSNQYNKVVAKGHLQIGLI